MTHSAIHHTFSKIEMQRKNLLAALRSYDTALLNQRPAENQWSMLEVINHLIMAEEAIYLYLLKKTQDKAHLQSVGLKEALRSLILNAYLWSPKKFIAPPQTPPVGDYTTLSEVEEAWTKVRANLAGIWTALPEDMLDKNWFKHPAAGKLSLMQMLTFMKAHVRHHEAQIDRTLKAVSK
jgi:uncharacterized damage-inducible protein DinB